MHIYNSKHMYNNVQWCSIGAREAYVSHQSFLSMLMY